MYIYVHIYTYNIYIYIYDQLGYTYILHTLYIYIYIIYNIYILYIYYIYRHNCLRGLCRYSEYMPPPPSNYCFQGLPFTISLRYATTISTCL